MLESLTFTGRELLGAVILAGLVYLLEVWLFSRNREARRDARNQARLDGLEEEVAALKTRIERLESRPAAESPLDTQKSLHAEAMRLARAGVSAQELAAQLGISLTEADLIVALHRPVP